MIRPLFLLGVVALVVSCAPRDPDVRDQVKKSAPVAEPELVQHPVGDMAHLKKRLEDALQDVRSRDIPKTKAFWTIFHGILGNGLDTKLYDADSKSYRNALQYIREGGSIRGMEFIAFEEGLDVKTTAADNNLIFVGQGHQDQFVAEIIQIGLPLDASFRVGERDYKFRDFCKYSKANASVTKNQELSWALIVIGEADGLEGEWKNRHGEKITFADIVRYELEQPIEANAACGGTHRLFGLTWAYNSRLRQKGAVDGVWAQTRDKIQEYVGKAKKYQNGDGSFSTKYLAGKERTGTMDQRLGSTGHVFEWLALALPDEELKARWMQEAAYATAKMVLDQRANDVDSGSLYHAAHGLTLYYDRLFGKLPVWVPAPK